MITESNRNNIIYIITIKNTISHKQIIFPIIGNQQKLYKEMRNSLFSTYNIMQQEERERKKKKYKIYYNNDNKYIINNIIPCCSEFCRIVGGLTGGGT